MRFEILGEPVGEGRPRAVRMGGLIRMHAAPKSAQWRALAADQIQAERHAAQVDMLGADVLVTVSVLAVMRRPKLPKKLGLGRIHRATKPDIDNIAKAAFDALVQGGAINDDRQIARAQIERVTAAVGEEARVIIVVERFA